MSTAQIISYPEGNWKVLLIDGAIAYENHSVNRDDIASHATEVKLLDPIEFEGDEDAWDEFIKQYPAKEQP